VPTIHVRGAAHAPAPFVFAYIDDYRNVPKFLHGLKQFEPTTEKTSGVGAAFHGFVHIKPVKLDAVMTISEWEENKSITIESIKGFSNKSRWSFEEVDAENCVLKVDFSYELPGGIAGKALGKAIEPVLHLVIRHTEENIRKQVEALYAAQQH